MFIYPHINPVAFSLGPIKVHWYGIMYLLGFLAAYSLARLRVRWYNLPWSAEQISDLIFYAAIGVIVGGRLGYLLFYNTQAFLHNPLILFKIWQGGMSFHGGLIGVAVASFYTARRMHRNFLEISDFIMPLVPLGLAAGRLGNFINGELWGRITHAPWAMIFPHVDYYPRHPSQLYEFMLEGVLLFIIIFYYAHKPRQTGRVTGLFLIAYALCRILIECFREPDQQLSFLLATGLTMGQWLSMPMLLLGLYLFFRRTSACKTI